MPKKAKPSIREYTKAQRHLPHFLKDFHDQKDFFKVLWEWQSRDEMKVQDGTPFVDLMKGHTWASQHVFTCDILLPFLAGCGYRLEKIRSPKMDYADLRKEINDMHSRMDDILVKQLGLTPIKEVKP